LSIEEKILQQFAALIIPDKRACRDPNDEIFTISSCLVFAFTVGPFSGTKLLGVG
jgi:hypothetical protein